MASASTTAPLSHKGSVPEWKKMKVQELREVLASKGLETIGLKSSLIERLENLAKSDVTTKSVMERTSGSSEETQVEEEGEVPQNDLNQQENPKAVEDIVSSGSENIPAAEQLIVKDFNGNMKQVEDRTILIPTKVLQPHDINGNLDCAAPLSELQKKQRRAERFGVEIKVSEEEKKRLRAARFGGTSSNLDKEHQSVFVDSNKMSPTSKETEAEKRKARAVRFGTLGSNKTSPFDEDAKKRARLARFGSSPDARTDPSSEEKKRARAARFGVATKEEAIAKEKKVQAESTNAADA